MAQDFSRARDLPAIARLAKALDFACSDAQAERLASYVELVVAWNRKLDLTAAKGATSQLEVLLGDAFVLASEQLVPRGARVVDVGSGAGAPMLPLLLLRDDLHATLVEPLRKRVAFLRTVLGSLSLVDRARVLEQKLDPSAPALATSPSEAFEPFDVALSRATLAPELWVAAGARLATRTLVLVAAQPLPAAPAGTQLLHTQRYALPTHQAARSIGCYARINDRDETGDRRAPDAPE